MKFTINNRDDGKMDILWSDKYRPESLNDLDYNYQLTKTLKNLAKTDDVPHIIFHGIRGAGKETRALLYLKQKFGPGIMHIQSDILEQKYPNKMIELQLKFSNYHYQINPSLHGVYDRLIIQDFIKHTAQYRSVLTEVPYRIIIIEEADELSYEAQQSLRRTLEKYVDQCRFIFLVSREGGLIDPLRSRCLQLRVPAPSDQEIQNILCYVAEQEGLELSDQVMQSILKYAGRNMDKALHSLQFLALKHRYILDKPDSINLKKFSDIDLYLTRITRKIFQGGSPETISVIRAWLYDLMIHNVDPCEIMRRLFQNIMRSIPDQYGSFQYQICKATDHYENTLRSGGKPIYHLEAYVIRVFQIVKQLQREINRSSSPSTESASTSNSIMQRPKPKILPKKTRPLIKRKAA